MNRGRLQLARRTGSTVPGTSNVRPTQLSTLFFLPCILDICFSQMLPSAPTSWLQCPPRSPQAQPGRGRPARGGIPARAWLGCRVLAPWNGVRSRGPLEGSGHLGPSSIGEWIGGPRAGIYSGPPLPAVASVAYRTHAHTALESLVPICTQRALRDGHHGQFLPSRLQIWESRGLSSFAPCTCFS